MGKRQIVILKVILWALCLAPIGIWIYQGLHAQLGANPVERIQNRTGLVTIRLLMLTLAITPLRRITGWNWAIKFRRPLGLFTFFYAFIHLLVYSVADYQLNIAEIVKDVAKRPFILLGMAGFLSLVPLAITSTTGWIRRLGGKNWNRLHKLIYFTGVAGVIHFWLRVKADHSEPNMYIAILAVLLAIRIGYWWRGRGAKAAARAPRPLQPATETE
jgi:methionine sulfoxide reductase heme-binding subunit